MSTNTYLPRAARLSGPKLILIAAVLAGALGLMRAGHAVLASSEVNGWFSYGLQAAHPVEIRIDGLEREAAYRVHVSRVSPRGNAEPMTHRFAGDGLSWHAANNYFGTVGIEMPREAVSDIDAVVIHIGAIAIETGNPLASPRWRELGESQQEGYARYQFVPSAEERPFTVLPVFEDVLNYVGDVTLAFWALFWAILVVAPPAAIFLVSRTNEQAASRMGRGIVVACIVAIGVVTAAQFVAPPSARNAAVFPVREVGTALSLAALLSLLIRSQAGSLAQWEPDRPDERWSQRWILPAIVLIGLALRLGDLDSLMQVDTYNVSAALALADTGEFAYDRNLDITHAVALLTEAFGRSLASARIPFIVAGVATIPLVYAIGAHVSTRVGAIAALLFAISPHHIAVANYIREYPVNLLVGQLIVLLLFCLFSRYRKRRWLFYPVFVLGVAGAFAAVYVYSEAVSNRTIPSVLQMNAFLAVPLLLHHIRENHRKALLPSVVLAALVLLAGFSVVHRLGPFSPGLVLDSGFLHVYFDPFIMRPMQWFSLSAISAIAPALLTLLPFLGRRRNPYLDAA
ncbi:MAG: hypothetical protein ACLFM0_10165, partial [Spirochaetales bacterium]